MLAERTGWILSGLAIAQMDTHIQIGPTGKKLLPLTVVQ
jgi:hypothetical protein